LTGAIQVMAFSIQKKIIGCGALSLHQQPIDDVVILYLTPLQVGFSV